MKTYASNHTFGPVVGRRNIIGSTFLVNISGKPLGIALYERGIKTKLSREDNIGWFFSYVSSIIKGRSDALKRDRIKNDIERMELEREAINIALSTLQSRVDSRIEQFEQKFSEKDIKNIVSKLPPDILKNPTYPSIISELSKKFPEFSKRQAGRVRAEIKRKYGEIPA